MHASFPAGSELRWGGGGRGVAAQVRQRAAVCHRAGGQRKRLGNILTASTPSHVRNQVVMKRPKQNNRGVYRKVRRILQLSPADLHPGVNTDTGLGSS